MVPVQGPAAVGQLNSYEFYKLPNGKSNFEVSGTAYAPDAASQALAIDPFGLAAAQAAHRRQNMNAQSQIGQHGGQNMNAQSGVGQVGRRQNMNAQAGVSQVGRRQNLNAQSGVSQIGRRQNMNAQSGISQSNLPAGAGAESAPVAAYPAAAYPAGGAFAGPSAAAAF